MIKLLKYLLCTIAITLTLGGCGFAPLNMKALPPQLKQVYYQADHAYGPVEVKLKKKLKSAGIILLPSSTKSALIINFSSNYSHTSYTNISSVQGSTYSLTYTATISISDFYHKTLLSPQNITVTRSVSLNPNEVFELTSQIEIIKQEMREDLINKIFFILTSHHTAKALKPKPDENSK